MSLDMTQMEGSVVREDRVSTVIALLPTSVQNRFSPLRHIRRSISLSNIVAPSFPCNEPLSSRPRSEGNTTPPAPVESSSTSREIVPHQDLQASRNDKLSISCANGVVARDRFARQGAQLVGVSLASGHQDTIGLGAFERDTYLDGLAYLLRGLPEDLTPHEQDRLRRAIPASLKDAQGSYTGIHPRNQGPPSALYRLTSSVSLRFVIAFSIVLPYLLLILRWLIGLERKYKVSEHVGQLALNTMNTVAYHSGRIIQASRGQEWRIGQLLTSSVLWTLEEVSKGVADGVDQGLSGMRTEQLQ